MWDCSGCGTLAIADSVELCPVCGADKSTGVEPSVTVTGPSPGMPGSPVGTEQPAEDVAAKSGDTGHHSRARRTPHPPAERSGKQDGDSTTEAPS